MKFDFKLALVILAMAGLFLHQSQVKSPQTDNLKTHSPGQSQLKLTSTDPDPLEGATLLPTQTITLTFSQAVPKSELKHHFDPVVEHQVEVVGGINENEGTTFKITFKKPLALGSGYTLFIEGGTHTKDQNNLAKESTFHFKTINYRGI